MAFEREARWLYDTSDVTSDRRTPRTGVRGRRTQQLVGADGSLDGGVGPFYGFRHIVDMIGQSVPGGSAADLTLRGFFPVTWRVGNETYAYGFVYRVVNPGNSQCQFYLTWRVGTSTAWNVVNLTDPKPWGTKAFHVVAFGRFVWLFVEGEEPFFFWLEGTILRIVTDTGVGDPPVLTGNAGNVIATPSSTFVPVGGLTTAVLGVLGAPPPGIVANGKVFIISLVEEDRTYTPLGMDCIRGPSECGLGSPQSDPVWNVSGTGYRDLWGGGLAGLEFRFGENYRFAYMLMDSRTGRRSAMSDVVQYGWGDLAGPAPEAFNPTSGYIVKFPGLEIVYDSDKYDTALVYRTTRTAVGPGVLQLDAVITLGDYLTSSQAGLAAPYKRAFYFYELPDTILRQQETFQGDLVFEPDVPTAGSAAFYDGVMMYGRLGRILPDEKKGEGLSVVRWSNPFDPGKVEQVSPLDRYELRVPSEEVLRFCIAGPNVLALTGSGQYLFRKEAVIIKGYPLHVGFGIPNARAACEISSMVYAVTEHGLISVSPNGDVSLVEAVNDVILREWRGDMDRVEMAYDATANVVWLLNPVKKRAVLLWMRTSAVTELYDVNFLHIGEGDVPEDVGVGTSPLKRRLIGVQKVLIDANTVRWRVMVPDSNRTVGRGTLMHPTGPVRLFLLTGIVGTSTVVTLTPALGSRVEGCRLYALEGAAANRGATIVRVISTAGNTTTVLLDAAEAAAMQAGGRADGQNGLDQGIRMGLSPVYFRWVGGQLPLTITDEDGTVMVERVDDAFRQRIAQSISCAFSDVKGEAATDKTNKDARYRGLLYRGNSDTPISAAFPRETNGDKLQSVEDGPAAIAAGVGDTTGRQGAMIFPGVEIVCPELDFRLLQVAVVGTITGSERERRPPTGPPL